MNRRAETTSAVTAAIAVLLASTALSRSYTDLSFLPPVVSAIIVAFGLGWVGRRLEVPAGLAPAVSFVGFIEYLTMVYFRKQAFLAVVPTPEVFRAAGRVIQQGTRDINQLAAPVVPTSELIFITVAGVFAVAVAVDLIALRLRRPVLAGLPLLALFVIPSSLSPTGAGWVSFALTAAGYLALLTTEGRDRVARWGRRLAATRYPVDDGYRRPVARAARGIGAAAIGFALVVPGLTPGLQNGLLTGTGAATGLSGGHGKGKGGSQSTTIDPVVELRKNLNQSSEHELIRVRTTEPQYLTMAVLDEFTGESWRVSKGIRATLDATKPIPLPPGLAEGVERHTIKTQISVSKRYDQKFLPVPYAPSKLTGLKGTWRYDAATRTIRSSNKSTRGSEYAAESTIVTPDPHKIDDDLPYPTEIAPYTLLAKGLVDPSVYKLAQRVTRRATTDWARVVALQNYFARDGGFTYSTTVGATKGTGRDALQAFLKDKVGYCEQYAASMAVMVRALGMPARVVVGFTAGTLKNDYYSITNKDAHSWPEVFFPQVGWVRFEPTPAGAGTAVSTPDVDLIVPTAAPSASASASASAEAGGGPLGVPRFRPDLDGPNSGGSSAGDFTPTTHTSRRPLLIALLLFLVLLIPVVPAATRSAVRRRARRRAATPRRRSHVAWRHLYEDAYDLGWGWPGSASPRVAATTLIASANLSGPSEAAVRRLAAAEENARYAPLAYAATSSPDFDSDVALIRGALLSSAPRRRRIRALLFPSSTVGEISRNIHVWSANVAATAGRVFDRLPARLRIRSN